MNIQLYDKPFYRGEIERINLALTQAIDESERKRLTVHLGAAKSHLESLETGIPLARLE